MRGGASPEASPCLAHFKSNCPPNSFVGRDMFRAKTLLVLGAGASFEVGLPIGETLLKQIAGLINFRFEGGSRLTAGDHLLLDALKLVLNEGREVERLNEHLRAGQRLRQSALQALSIDNVIDALADSKVELVGKLGILRAILKAESGSACFRVPEGRVSSLDILKFTNTWYDKITKILTENVKKSEIERIFENLEIINFNYDRCLERYLPFSIAQYYGVGIGDVERIMQNVPIHRPYGSCGKLSWMRGDGPRIDFGHEDPSALASAVEQIRTFTEQVQEGEELDAIRSAVTRADRIVFLGFAFHRQNLRLIGAPIKDHTEILATAFQISESDKSVIKSELAKTFSFERDLLSAQRIELAYITCSDLFKQYWRTLTAEAGDRQL